MKLIVGLGNPGRKYEQSRHNLGFLCVNRFAKDHGIRMEKKQGEARTGTGTVAGQEVLLARPQTYMNLSGRAVKALAGKFRVKPEDIIVVYDDFDLPLGRIRIRPEGGPGGHNGMKSIIAELGSRSFVRVRVGIGQPGSGGLDLEEDEIIGYVLSGFNREERKVIDEAVPVVSEALLAILADGVTEAMNTYNRKNGQ